MKKYIKYIILTTWFINYSCSEDWLDLKNPNSLTSDNFYKTEEQADQTLVACYDPLKGRGLVGALEYAFLHYAADPDCFHESAPHEYFLYTSSDQRLDKIYLYLYRGLYRTNLGILHFPNIDMPEQKKARYMAEAKFLRAYYGFYATVQFNEPPIIDQVYTELGVKLGNSTQAEWWAFIEKDLMDALEGDVLPKTLPSDEVGRVTWGAAKTLLGKAYLYQQKWSEARAVFNDIIAESQQTAAEAGTGKLYELNWPRGVDSTDFVFAYLTNFTFMNLTSYSGNVYASENNKESIFEVQNNNDNRFWLEHLPGWSINGSLNSAYNAPHGYRNIAPSPDFCENAFEKVPADHPGGLVYDPRRSATIFVDGDTLEFRKGVVPADYLANFGPGVLFDHAKHANPAISQKYGVRKYYYPLHWGNLAPFNDPNNWRVFRYSDVLLMFAEADYHVNGSASIPGLNALNLVRQRVGLPDRTELLPEYIMQERRVEFGLELMRFLDLIRWSRIGTDSHGNSWVNPADLPNLMPGFILGKNEYFPIPINEINLMDGMLKQNPNW